MSRSRKIGCYNDRIAPKFDRHRGNAAAEVPVNCQCDLKSLKANRLRDFARSCGKTSVRLVKRGPGMFSQVEGIMMASSNGSISRVTGPLCGEFNGEFPSQRPVTWSFDVFFDLRPNKRLSKQSWGWWFATPSRSLWRQCNDNVALCSHSVTHIR